MYEVGQWKMTKESASVGTTRANKTWRKNCYRDGQLGATAGAKLSLDVPCPVGLRAHQQHQCIVAVREIGESQKTVGAYCTLLNCTAH